MTLSESLLESVGVQPDGNGTPPRTDLLESGHLETQMSAKAGHVSYGQLKQTSSSPLLSRQATFRQPRSPTSAPAERLGLKVDSLIGWKIILVAVVVIWLLLGTIFYQVHANLTTPQALYYTVQAVLNVGYGVPTLPEDSWTVLVTILMAAFGASFVSAALAIFIQRVLDEREAIHGQVMDFTVVDADGSGDLDYDEFRRFVLRNREWGFTSESIPALFKQVDTNCDGKVSPEEFEAFLEHADAGNLWAKIRVAMLQYGSSIKAFSLLAVWLVLGLIFAIFYEDYHVGKAVLFAVLSLSTAGLQGPLTDTFSVLFTALYLLVGVPTFAMCLAKVAGIIINRYQDHELKMKLLQKVDEADLQLAQTMSQCGDQNGEVGFHEFLCLKLMKLGRLDLDVLHAIERDFKALDKDHTGRLSREELFELSGISSPRMMSPSRPRRN